MIIGPRQCGKTTLARTFGGTYFDLEQEKDRLRLDVEWDSLTGVASAAASAPPLILGEAQAWPDVFARLRGAIDAHRRRNGRFLLLGSVSPGLMRGVSESLAGRLSVVELTPFLLEEVLTGDVRDRWLVGGYPDGGILDRERFPQWQSDYLALLVGRDLPAWGWPARPPLANRLLRMLAAAHGQLWNASQIGRSLGISYATVNSHLDLLEGAFLIRRLPPYHANLRKRLVKSPKLYWRDSGLVHALLGMTREADLLVQPWVGASWEGFVIEQILGTLASLGHAATPFFFRTSDGYELDLVLELGGKRWAFEIKLTSEPKEDDLRRLEKTADLIGAERRILVSFSARAVHDATRISCSLPWLIEFLRGGTW
ncbi:MAG: ATP-binding protein [Planctomycetes bacterium]|nr:ATP-binding protein [Planctomycetota bacterium]